MENFMNRRQFLKLWSVTVGSMDAVTGLLLICAPALVLKLLAVDLPSADALVFIGWIGVFVTGVGLSYALALGGTSYGEPVWMFTAMIRLLVALFLSVRILDETLAVNWGIVATSDGFVGFSQIIILRLGWWKEGPE